MMIRLFVAVLASIIGISAYADAKKETSKDTIPFIIYKNRIIYYVLPIAAKADLITQATAGYSVQTGQDLKINEMSIFPMAEQETNTSNIQTSDVKNFVGRVRDAICSGIGDADVRVWISTDASGKLLGVGATTQSGLEVTFHCKGK